MMALAQRLRVKHSSGKLIDAAELARTADRHVVGGQPADDAETAGAATKPDKPAKPAKQAGETPTKPSKSTSKLSAVESKLSKQAAVESKQAKQAAVAAKAATDRPKSSKSAAIASAGPAARAHGEDADAAAARKAGRAQSVSHGHSHSHGHRPASARPHAKTTADASPMPSPSPGALQRPRQHSTASSANSYNYGHYNHLAERSTVASSTSSGGSSDRPEQAVDVLFHGPLAARRGGLLKVAEKRYYFLARRKPELFCCRDETSFQLWLASGHSLDDGDAFARANGLAPVSVATVLRADPLDTDRRSLSIVASSASKCTTLRFTAESSERCALWVAALREVQVTQSHPREAKLPSAADKKLLLPLQAHEQLRRKSSSSSDHVQASGSSAGGHDPIKRRTSGASSTSSGSSGKTPRVYATGRLQTRAMSSEHRSEEEDEAAPRLGRSDEHGDVRTRRLESNSSFLSTASAASTSSQSNANVVLFVPAAGSSISVSDSKLTRAKQELAALVARGGKPPSRGSSDGSGGELDKNVAWRYGPPEYALSDLEYVRGKQREHDATPLESYVEECCQTFLMEATHKATYHEWRSVNHGAFYLQVNDGVHVRGSEIQDTDMFGMLYMTGVDLTDLDPASNASEDPRAVLTEAFADGFPMEVLEVFTQPPQCYFSWRHWGRFTGKFGGVRGDGALVEVRGFGQMTIDGGEMRDLRLFFKQKELFVKLQHEAQRISSSRAAAVGANGSVDARIGRSMSVASIGSASGSHPPPPPMNPPSAVAQSPAPSPSPAAPATRKVPRQELKTDDIIAGLANFTLESKQTRGKAP